MTKRMERAKVLHRLFDVGIVIKGIDGILEIVGGIMLMLVTKPALNGFVVFLTQRELAEDPQDFIAGSLRHMAATLSSDAKVFGSIYLMVHGCIKVFLVIGLGRGKLWSYPAALSLLSLFIVYQCYRMIDHSSIILLFLIALDSAIVLLIGYEYAVVRRRMR
jgi:uncharacterized membrane protein